MAPDPYYLIFHVVVFEYSILTMISGTIYIYPILQASIIILSVLSVYILISRFLAKTYKSFIPLAELPLIVALLYMATPPLGGFDIIPQIYSMTLAIIALFSLTTTYYSIPGYRQGVYLFTFIAIMAIISHLSSAILIYAFLLALYSEVLHRSVRRTLLVSAATILVATFTYLMYATFRFASLISTLKALYEVIESGSKPIGVPIVSRAYQELGGVEIWILSWMLLPALSASILTYIISTFFFKKRKLELSYLRVPLVFLLIMVSMIATGGLARLTGIEAATGVDMLRYPVFPAYYGMYIAVPLLTILLIGEKYNRSWKFQANTFLFSLHGILLVILILFVTIISGINDPARSPWNGEPKMAPETFNDRMEMLYLNHIPPEEEMFYVRVHDVHVLQYKLRWLTGDCYSNEEVMKCVINHDMCSSEALQILQKINSPLLVITYKSLMSNNSSYNIIASLNEHVILYVANIT